MGGGACAQGTASTLHRFLSLKVSYLLTALRFFYQSNLSHDKMTYDEKQRPPVLPPDPTPGAASLGIALFLAVLVVPFISSDESGNKKYSQPKASRIDSIRRT